MGGRQMALQRISKVGAAGHQIALCGGGRRHVGLSGPPPPPPRPIQNTHVNEHAYKPSSKFEFTPRDTARSETPRHAPTSSPGDM